MDEILFADTKACPNLANYIAAGKKIGKGEMMVLPIRQQHERCQLPGNVLPFLQNFLRDVHLSNTLMF